MSYDVEETVQDWVLSLSCSEIDSYLSRMELNPASPDEVIARRKTLRQELLRRIVMEEDGTFLNTTSWDVHPLEVVLKSEVMLEIITKTTAQAASHSTHSTQRGRSTS